MRKPATCMGCPFFGDGDGFVPDEMVPGAKVTVWLQNPGRNEEAKAQPAVGATGDDLNEKFLPRAGLTRGVDVNVCNVLRCRWTLPNGEKTNNLPSGKPLREAVAHCRIYDRSPSSPLGAHGEESYTELGTGAGHDHNQHANVACGALAWKLFDGPGTVTEWRGFPHPEKKVLCTLHPADLYRNPAMKLPVSMDWSKVPGFQKGEWPKQIPPFLVVERGADSHLVTEWVSEALEKAPYVVIDTEFTRDTKYLLTLGLGYPGETGCQIWFNGIDPTARQVIRTALWRLVHNKPVVFQNAMADVPVLERNLGIHYNDYKQIEDTMLAHAVLWSEWPHTLEYLASIYGQYPKMKHLSTSNPKLYNWGDVLDTISVWEGVSGELKLDAASRGVYRDQSLPLVPIILRRAAKGIKVDAEKVREAVLDLKQRQEWASALANAAYGHPVKLGSDKQLKSILYGERGYPVQTDKEKKVSIGADAVVELRKFVGPMPDLEEEGKNGLSIYEAQRRIDDGADPILEARVVYAAAKQEYTHFIKPLEGRERVYPNIKIHAQASGRWSITEPPLQQFPGRLGGLLVPDVGDVWIGWDWDQIELRLLAALADDKPYLEAFERGWDVHTLNACDLFGMPYPADRRNPHGDAAFIAATQWHGKDDLRRLFAKRFVYRLNYGGDARTAGDIPGAKQLNLGSSGLVAASRRYLNAHPAMLAWRNRVAVEAQQTRVSRTFAGRRRRLLGEGKGVVREAYNHPLQGGVADILNLCTIQIAAALPGASLVYTVHDSAWWAVRAGDEGLSMQTIRAIIEQKWSIGGVEVSIPAKFKDLRFGS